jgi:hypothetical protein
MLRLFVTGDTIMTIKENSVITQYYLDYKGSFSSVVSLVLLNSVKNGLERSSQSSQFQSLNFLFPTKKQELEWAQMSPFKEHYSVAAMGPLEGSYTRNDYETLFLLTLSKNEMIRFLSGVNSRLIVFLVPSAGRLTIVSTSLSVGTRTIKDWSLEPLAFFSPQVAGPQAVTRDYSRGFRLI